MKILLCHNHYQQPGGEDQSFLNESRMLESRGHQVLRYTLHNDSINSMGRVRLSAKTIWHRHVYRELRDLMRTERPMVAHFTNTFPLISPAAYYAAHTAGVPVVQSLRNYRLLCPNGLFLRDGKPCEDCLSRRVALPAVKHKCYRDDRAASLVVTTMLSVHRAIGTWSREVDLYFTPSEFARRKYIQAGFPAEKIVVKPNFVDPDPGVGTGAGGYAVFVGRLSPEKGIATLLKAWVSHTPGLPLKIVGDGPMADDVRAAVAQCPRIQWLGRRSIAEVMALIGDAKMLVFPSLAYEVFGRSTMEAFATGTPVLASDSGAAAELVTPRVNGLHFESGNPAALALAVDQFAESAASMRSAARDEYLRYYTADRNHEKLMAIYRQAASIHAAAGQPSHAPLAGLQH